jgi:hypothetical protein
MSPRPVPHKDDLTAAAFLDAGAALIDAMLVAEPSSALPPRLRQLHYPAPLEWIRIEDVLRLVGGSASAGRKAFYNRWPTKDDYIRDCFIHTLLYRDRTGVPLENVATIQGLLKNLDVPLPLRVRQVASALAAGLLNDPRASLLSHAAVMVHHDPETAEVVIEASARERETWRVAYQGVFDDAGLVLRPGWTIDGLIVIVQMMIDGMVMSHRVGVTETARDNAALAASLGDALVALLGSAVDWEQDGETVDAWIEDRYTARQATGEPPEPSPS